MFKDMNRWLVALIIFAFFAGVCFFFCFLIDIIMKHHLKKKYGAAAVQIYRNQANGEFRITKHQIYLAITLTGGIVVGIAASRVYGNPTIIICLVIELVMAFINVKCLLWRVGEMDEWLFEHRSSLEEIAAELEAEEKK